MTSGDYFKSLYIDESGKLKGEYYIHDLSESYEFKGIYTSSHVTLHIYTDTTNKDSYIVKDFAVVKFDNSELILASSVKGYFFTRDASNNPYTSIPVTPYLLGKWEHKQSDGAKTYYYFYGDGSGKVDFESTNESSSYNSKISSWFTINDWLFIKQITNAPQYNGFKVYHYKLDSDNLVLQELDINGILDSYTKCEYIKIEAFAENSTDIDNQKSSHIDNEEAAYEYQEDNHSTHTHNEGQVNQTTAHKTTVPVQVWHQCTNCLNSGQCPYCYGQGYIINAYGDTQDCPVCTNGRCVMCGGQGGHYETEYQTRVDYY